MSSPPSGPPSSVARRGWGRWAPALLVPVALASDLWAGLPLRTYYFRDFTATFFPLRLFAAREIREGRLPAWNPYIFEGSFQLPALYPPDLLLALWPSPVFASWLLTLHLPVAALAAWWLARELGVSREGAVASGALYALGGFALSTLNLYVFLQALALAPLVAGLLRRAALDGGRAIVGAATVLALALATLGVEFVGQALLLGLGLSLAARPARTALPRLAAAAALGVGLAGVPLALTLGLLPETVRGAGFASDVRLGNAVHPAVLLQTVLPRLFGVPQAPAEAWWGGGFFSKGLPYFITLYTGPVFLALGALGLGAMRRSERAWVLALGGLGLLYALGERGGLATLVAQLPGAGAFRFPSKALLLPHAVLALASGFAVDRLRRGAEPWRPLAAGMAGIGGVAVVVAVSIALAPPGLVAWSGVEESFWPHLVRVVVGDAALVFVMTAVTLALALAVVRGRLRTGAASSLLVALAIADLARAGAGVNPQAPAGFFDPVPEMRGLGLDALDGGRVFSYGYEQSPAFRGFLGRGGGRLTLAATWIARQILAPYSNVVDRVEAPEATDLTSFVPRARELGAGDYEPGAVDRLVPWLRNAAVTRVVSLDPLTHADLELLATVAAGPPGLDIHVYRLVAPWPRAYLACRAVSAAGPEEARALPYAAGFDPALDVALEGGPAPDCGRGRVERIAFAPGEERYTVEGDGTGYLVIRGSFARGWVAEADGRPAEVVRANGKHRAVRLSAGRHDVTLRYRPPGLRPGLALTVLAAGMAVALWVRGATEKARP